MAKEQRVIKEMCSGAEIAVATAAVVTAVAEAPKAVKVAKDFINKIEGK